MMRYIAPMCLVLACFTTPRGELGVWIVKSQVIAIEHAGSCDPRANSKIVTSQGTVCVKETPQEVIRTLNSLKDDGR